MQSLISKPGLLISGYRRICFMFSFRGLGHVEEGRTDEWCVFTHESAPFWEVLTISDFQLQAKVMQYEYIIEFGWD